ncbi:MAG: hypothetical protein KDH92_14615, partial [Chloroflexi bacterium]|nr:hypothetical protein [Chloroflexota bacterium]
DGSPEGTRMLADIAAGLDGSEPDSFVGFNGRLVFAASDAPGGANMEPWISDGSAAGTRVLRDLNPGGRGFNQGFAPHAGRLYFGGDDGGGGELWVTDGEPDGTHAVFASAMRGRGSVPAGFVSFGNLLFFQAFHFSYGIEPWVSDGTEPGTRLLADVNPGEVASSFPAEASPLGDRLYFSADREGLGRELWVTDGTTAETRVVSDLRPGALGSDPSALLAQAEQLYFAASDPALGDELRVLGPESAPSDTPQATPPAPTTRPPGETPPAQSGRILLPRLDRGVQP